jgi:hypothetical protein
MHLFCLCLPVKKAEVCVKGTAVCFYELIKCIPNQALTGMQNLNNGFKFKDEFSILVDMLIFCGFSNVIPTLYKKNLSSLENQKIKTYSHSNDQLPLREEDCSPHPLYSTLSSEYTDSWTYTGVVSSENQNNKGAFISTQVSFPQTTEIEKTLSSYTSKNPFKPKKTEPLSGQKNPHLIPHP